MKRGYAKGILALAAVLAACAVAQQKGGENESGPYEVVAGWPQPLHDDGWSWGSTAGIWAESPERKSWGVAVKMVRRRGAHVLAWRRAWRSRRGRARRR